jgi:hypothetical protein
MATHYTVHLIRQPDRTDLAFERLHALGDDNDKRFLDVAGVLLVVE